MKQLKKVVKQLINEYELGCRTLEHGSGLCYELYEEGSEKSYDLMQVLMCEHARDYCKGISEKGVFSKERYYLLLLINAMSAKDIRDLLKNSEGFLYGE